MSTKLSASLRSSSVNESIDGHADSLGDIAVDVVQKGIKNIHLSVIRQPVGCALPRRCV